MQFFYDGQIRRYLTQIIRLLSNFSYQDGDGQLRQIPVTYGDLTRQVASIIRDNSENKIPSAPRMAVYITGIELDRQRLSDASYVNKVNIRERAYDSQGKEYLNEQGKNYTVERLHPAPYTLSVNADIWATNTEMKLQIMEQILTLFNPSLEIQTTDNFIDWTSLSVVNLELVNFSNRNVPVGVDSEIDIATLGFSTPIYLSAPAKVKRLGVITNIIANIFNEENGDIDLGNSEAELGAYKDALHPIEQTTQSTDSSGEVDIETQRKVDPLLNERVTQSTTFRDYGLYVEGTQARIVYNREVGTTNWRVLLEAYPGTYTAGLSQIRMRTEGSDNFIVGTFALNPLDERIISVTWDSDTLPSNDVITGPARNPASYTSIDYVIEPSKWNPTSYKTTGLRVLIVSDINPSDQVGKAGYDGPDAWKNTDTSDPVAEANDIIEWTGTAWQVVFDASATTDITHIKNLNTGIQYKWTGTDWIKSWEGEYSGGNWMLFLDG